MIRRQSHVYRTTLITSAVRLAIFENGTELIAQTTTTRFTCATKDSLELRCSKERKPEDVAAPAKKKALQPTKSQG